MLNLPDLAGKKIFVTGGAGFLGRHLLPKLLACGCEVSCLARSHESAAKLPKGINAVLGDCGSEADMAAAISGSNAVIHLAGLLFGASWRDYMAANSKYAHNLCRACADSPGRVIFVSSLAASGPCSEVQGRNESRAPEPVSAYGWSKLAAENIFKSALGDRAVILRPPVIYGSGDRALLPVFKCCKAGLGVAPLRDFPLSLIHADDAADAIILSLLPQASGTYHLGDGEIHTMTQFCEAIGRHFGRKRLIMLRSPALLLAASALAGSGANLVRKSFWPGGRYLAWNWDKYRESSQPGWVADSSRIAAELGFVPAHSLEAGIAETAAGYAKDGWL